MLFVLLCLPRHRSLFEPYVRDLSSQSSSPPLILSLTRAPILQDSKNSFPPFLHSTPHLPIARPPCDVPHHSFDFFCFFPLVGPRTSSLGFFVLNERYPVHGHLGQYTFFFFSLPDSFPKVRRSRLRLVSLFFPNTFIKLSLYLHRRGRFFSTPFSPLVLGLPFSNFSSLSLKFGVSFPFYCLDLFLSLNWI